MSEYYIFIGTEAELIKVFPIIREMEIRMMLPKKTKQKKSRRKLSIISREIIKIHLSMIGLG